jgi:hypothetical protein
MPATARVNQWNLPVSGPTAPVTGRPRLATVPADRLLTPLGGYAFALTVSLVGFWLPLIRWVS